MSPRTSAQLQAAVRADFLYCRQQFELLLLGGGIVEYLFRLGLSVSCCELFGVVHVLTDLPERQSGIFDHLRICIQALNDMLNLGVGNILLSVLVGSLGGNEWFHCLDWILS